MWQISLPICETWAGLYYPFAYMVIKLEFILRLKIKRNDWLLADLQNLSSFSDSKLSAMIGCLRTRVRKQPTIALYFETVLKFHNLKALSQENLSQVVQTTKAQTSLRIHAVWSVPLLISCLKVSYLDFLQANLFSRLPLKLSRLVLV